MYKLLLKIPYVKKLYDDSRQLHILRRRTVDLWDWCSCDSPEIGCAARWLLNPEDVPQHQGGEIGISGFREALRQGKCTFEFAKNGREFPPSKDGDGMHFDPDLTTQQEEGNT